MLALNVWRSADQADVANYMTKDAAIVRLAVLHGYTVVLNIKTEGGKDSTESVFFSDFFLMKRHSDFEGVGSGPMVWISPFRSTDASQLRCCK